VSKSVNSEISIPSGAIKSNNPALAFFSSFVISIPSGAIKSDIRRIIPFALILISIPSGAIKSISSDSEKSLWSLFQFLLVRLKVPAEILFSFR